MNDAHAGIVGEIGVEQRAGGVGRAVVNDDNAKMLSVRRENGKDSLDDDTLFVVRGNEYGDGGLRIGHDRAIGAHFFNDSQDADDEGPAADENDTGDENGGDEEARPMVNAEDEAVGTSLPTLLGGKRNEYLRTGFVDEVRDGDEVVALRAELVNDSVQDEKSLGAIAAAIVEQDDVTVVRVG